jgi:arylsulfatase
MRREKFTRMREMDLLDEHWSLSPRDPEVPAWDSLSPEKQDEFDLRMAIYSAQIHCMDQGIGRIVRTLEEGGILDDTLIIFLSDNGGCHEEIHGKSRAPKDFGTDRSFESYGRPWANYSNTPFREFKSWVHEGGIATPMIAHWGNGITDGGRFYHCPVHITDFMPTCLDLARTDYAPDPARNAWDLVGTSFTPAFAGEPIERDCIFWEHEANRALREGKWKLVAKGIDGPWELYDMEIDRTELNDLSGEQPDRAERMASKWEHIAETTDVLPLDGRTWGERCKD